VALHISSHNVDLTAPAYSNRHSLTVNGKNEDITREDLETVGQNNDIQDYNTLIDAVANAVAKFEFYARELGVDEKLSKSIQADFIKV
jgi:serine/threonine-protein kinase HipA